MFSGRTLASMPSSSNLWFQSILEMLLRNSGNAILRLWEKIIEMPFNAFNLRLISSEDKVRGLRQRMVLLTFGAGENDVGG